MLCVNQSTQIIVSILAPRLGTELSPEDTLPVRVRQCKFGKCVTQHITQELVLKIFCDSMNILARKTLSIGN
jgi:hypothetical protein